MFTFFQGQCFESSLPGTLAVLHTEGIIMPKKHSFWRLQCK